MAANTPKIQERRKHPRLPKKLPLKVRVDSFDLVAQTQNISSSGAYCQVDKYIEPMTRVGIILLLAMRQKNNKLITRKLNCEGVVVRAEQAKDYAGKFNIAIFFNNMKKTDTNIVARYIESHLQPAPATI